VLEGTADGAVDRGAYVLADAEGDPDVVLVGTGSEVSLCLEAAEVLAGDGTAVRVVSMPSWDLFAAQDEGYRRAVLPDGVPKLSVEAGSTFGWDRWVDRAHGLDHFGASAPGKVAMERLGFTALDVAHSARTLLA
jgi:transketolase